MLEREGFERSGLVDIFDAGPTMTCQRDWLATIRNARTLRVAIGSAVDAEARLLSRTTLPDFRATRAPAAERDGRVVIDAEAAEVLHLHEGDMIKVSA